MSRSNKEFEGLNNSPSARQAQALAERQRATISAIVVFFLFVTVGSISALPAKGVRKKSELIFVTALVTVVGLGVAISVKISLDKKSKERLREDLKRFD